MPKVFTMVPGLTSQIGNHGVATNESPCVVPEAVARELAGLEGFRIDPDELGPVEDVRAFYSVTGDVYHTDPECVDGNNIERKNKRRGTGGKAPCAKCVQPAAQPAEVKE